MRWPRESPSVSPGGQRERGWPVRFQLVSELHHPAALTRTLTYLVRIGAIAELVREKHTDLKWEATMIKRAG